MDRRLGIKKSLLQSLGHDLKAPLATARALVADATSDDARERIEGNFDRVENTLRSITDFTQATLRDGHVEKVDLTSLLDSLAEEARYRGHDAELVLNITLTVPARYYAIERAFRNLIENAAIHGNRAQITLRTDEDFGIVVIDDEGDGIDEANIEAMFEPFSRLSNDPRESGLGLAISQTIILDHGGSLTLENRAQGGLRQTIRLPI